MHIMQIIDWDHINELLESRSGYIDLETKYQFLDIFEHFNEYFSNYCGNFKPLGGCWSPYKYQIKRGYIPCNSSNNNCVMVVKLNSKPSPIPGQGCTIFQTFLALNPDTEITFKLEVLNLYLS